MTAGKVIAAIFGVIFAPAAIGLLVGGIALIVVNSTARDVDGFVHSPTYEFATSDYAITSDEFEVARYPGDWWPAGLLDVRFEMEVDGTPVFFGIGPSDEVEDYLGDVARSQVVRLGVRAEEITYRDVGGGAPATAPGEQTFWVLAATTSDGQTLTWEVERGDWSIVVMNADGSAGIAADIRFGARLPVLLWVGIGMVVGGLLVGGLAAGLLVVAFSRPGGAGTAQPTGQADFSAVGETAYPVVVEGYIDEPLSRWMWLVKWFLAIPHFIILGFLWIGFSILTFFAFFAILFTGRYPRAMFDFNVGVMRWSWRVIFYCSSVIATDRYPPFTLAPADYPARLDVAYPERLSQGLVLIKWWLLAIPHYIIVGLFTSGLIWWATDDWGGDPFLQIGGGLIAILALISVIVLLFTGRYPRPMFDLLMGLNRWVFRVAAYATLMRDEYPPFRLDMGGSEPTAAAVTGARQSEPPGSAQEGTTG